MFALTVSHVVGDLSFSSVIFHIDNIAELRNGTHTGKFNEIKQQQQYREHPAKSDNKKYIIINASSESAIRNKNMDHVNLQETELHERTCHFLLSELK